MKRLFYSGLLAMVALFANAQTPLVTQNGGHCYTLGVPDYMVKTFDLNDVATLQYLNAEKDAYLIVIDDSKEHLKSAGLNYTSPKGFLQSFLKEYNAEAVNRKVGKISEFTALGNKAAQAEFSWTADNIDFFMLVTVVETKGYFYKVLSWTVAANAAALKKDFIAISKSLKD